MYFTHRWVQGETVLPKYKRKMDFGYLSFVIISTNSLWKSPEGAKTKLKDPELIIISPLTSKVISFPKDRLNHVPPSFNL